MPLYYGLVTLHHALSSPYIVQDDARQHVAFLPTVWDSTLFPAADPIAHYFPSVAPLGYRLMYQGFAQGGLSPLVAAKLLPLPLALVTTLYLYRAVVCLSASPLAALLTTVVLNQQLWLNDDLVSATPRAFIYPLFAAFLYYRLRSRLIPGLIALALLGTFFPPLMLVAIALLTVPLVNGQNRRPGLQAQRTHWRWWITSVVVTVAILLPLSTTLSSHGPAITAAQMRQLPEYGLGGRNEYFGVHPLDFLFNGNSGLRIPVFPSIIWVGFCLPWMVHRSSPHPHLAILRQPQRLTLLRDWIVASLGLYGLAHLLLLRLHFPSRYTYHSLRFILAIAAGLVLAEWGLRGWQWWRSHPLTTLTNSQRWRVLGIGLGMMIVIIVPLVPPLMWQFQGWVQGPTPALYQFLSQQPLDTLVGGLSENANNIPAFAQRSTVTGREFALPHHPRYYHGFRDRTTTLLTAYYSPNPDAMATALNRDGIDFVLIDATTFTPTPLQQDWLAQSTMAPAVQQALADLSTEGPTAMEQQVSHCTAAREGAHRLLDVPCLIHAANHSPEDKTEK